jgi:hypothetical protein
VSDKLVLEGELKTHHGYDFDGVEISGAMLAGVVEETFKKRSGNWFGGDYGQFRITIERLEESEQ